MLFHAVGHSAESALPLGGGGAVRLICLCSVSHSAGSGTVQWAIVQNEIWIWFKLYPMCIHKQWSCSHMHMAMWSCACVRMAMDTCEELVMRHKHRTNVGMYYEPYCRIWLCPSGHKAESHTCTVSCSLVCCVNFAIHYYDTHRYAIGLLQSIYMPFHVQLQ